MKSPQYKVKELVFSEFGMYEIESIHEDLDLSDKYVYVCRNCRTGDSALFSEESLDFKFTRES